MTRELKLGMIGLSPGNGHPYSWSAIFNGYDRDGMERCGFPVVPRYLEERSFPEDAITGACVSHVWTQDRRLSERIALASRIAHVVDGEYTDLIGKVDAILLARDDAEHHLEFAAPFLEAGLPIFIDKPLALSVGEAQALINLQRFPGQLFSCSAMRYARELVVEDSHLEKVGDLRFIDATVAKDWDKYAVHVIDPILGNFSDRDVPARYATWRSSDRTTLHLDYSDGVEIQISTLGSLSPPLGFRLVGTKGWVDLRLMDTFSAFRAALQDFVDGVVSRDVRISAESMLAVVRLIEMGRTA